MHKLLCLVIVILSHQQIQLLVKAKVISFSTDLIHHDSPLSPFYNHSLTPSQLLRKAALRSKTRIDYFNSLTDEKSIQSTVSPNTADYLMTLYIGSPPIQFLAEADTGSDLIWVQCNSCQQCFNPQGSSTYQQLFCSSGFCQALPRYGCDKANRCVYNYSYGTGAEFTIGVLSSDTISLDSTTGGVVAFPASVFGCGYDNEGKFFSGGSAGLVGLGGGLLSLVSQLGAQIGHRFSYCLVPYDSSATSKLRFGQDATISGASGVVSTPLITNSNKPTYYYLTLRGISIGQETTQTPQSDGNIIIDSGTTLTMLNSGLYGDLEAIVRRAIGVEPVQDPSRTFSLCYGANSVANFPDMIFHFSGADLSLRPVNTFRGYGDVVCMSIVPSNGLSIFGNLAQINFQVEYDLQGRQVSFAPTDCTQK